MSILGWIEDQRKLKILNTPKMHPFSEESHGLWTRCETCGVILYIKHLRENQRVCAGCGAHLQMDSQERIDDLIDPDTWRGLDELLSPGDPLAFIDKRPYKLRLRDTQRFTGLRDAIQTGTGCIDDIPVAIGIMDFSFMGGSMGSVVGEKITRLIEYATQEGLALILLCSSGGARMQEGILSLMQMAKISAALKIYQSYANLLYISILTSPTTGGVTASFAMLGDLILAEPKALIGFAGRRVIEQTLQEQLPEDFQTAEYLLHHGLLDLIVSREYLKGALSEILILHNEAPFKKRGFLPHGIQSFINPCIEESLRRKLLSQESISFLKSTPKSSSIESDTILQNNYQYPLELKSLKLRIAGQICAPLSPFLKKKEPIIDPIALQKQAALDVFNDALENEAVMTDEQMRLHPDYPAIKRAALEQTAEAEQAYAAFIPEPNEQLDESKSQTNLEKTSSLNPVNLSLNAQTKLSPIFVDLIKNWKRLENSNLSLLKDQNCQTLMGLLQLQNPVQWAQIKNLVLTSGIRGHLFDCYSDELHTKQILIDNLTDLVDVGETVVTFQEIEDLEDTEVLAETYLTDAEIDEVKKLKEALFKSKMMGQISESKLIRQIENQIFWFRLMNKKKFTVSVQRVYNRFDCVKKRLFNQTLNLKIRKWEKKSLGSTEEILFTPQTDFAFQKIIPSNQTSVVEEQAVGSVNSFSSKPIPRDQQIDYPTLVNNFNQILEWYQSEVNEIESDFDSQKFGDALFLSRYHYINWQNLMQ